MSHSNVPTQLRAATADEQVWCTALVTHCALWPNPVLVVGRIRARARPGSSTPTKAVDFAQSVSDGGLHLSPCPPLNTKPVS